MEENLKFEELPRAISELVVSVNQIKKLLEANPHLVLEKEEEFLTIDQASDLTHLAKQTIYQLVCERKIPYLKRKGSKRLLFSSEDLKNWLREGRKKPR